MGGRATDHTVVVEKAGSSPPLPDPKTGDLEALGRRLAESHTRRPQDGRGIRRADLLSSRLDRYKALLEESSRRLRAQASQTGQLSSAAEWLLDNYYVASQALREVQQDLPPNYERQLPRLRVAAQPAPAPGQARQPGESPIRIYEIARQITQAERALLDLGRIQLFLQRYQEILPLTMGELWAFPTMLRLATLQCLLTSIARLSQGPEKQGQSGITRQAEDADLTAPSEASDPQLVEHCIRSLRALAVADWKDFFESASLAEKVLRQDPAGLYRGMAFQTRDEYRKTVEEIAVGCSSDELDVAVLAVRLARARVARPRSHRPNENQGNGEQRAGWDGFRSRPESHVGYYLLGPGRTQLERASGCRPTWRWLRRSAASHPTLLYLGSILLATLTQMLIVLELVPRIISPSLKVPLVFLLAIVPALTISVDLVNWAATQIVRPRRLPRMDFSAGVPEECAAAIVIPALITSSAEVDSLLEQLEMHCLRNPDPELYYVLVSDYADAPSENQPGDAVLVQRARLGIRRLNQKYRRETTKRFEGQVSQQGRFALLHRGRRWNPAEGVWMGWERKRGKLHELNQLILRAQSPAAHGRRGAADGPFPIREGNLSFLQKVRYVITLDADTILPRDAARRMVATLAHPLNRAVIRAGWKQTCANRVAAGYTILQPRTEINPLSSGRSAFTRILSGDAGLDLYTQAVSDIYQDLFGEGIYVGKGAYDIRSFERSLEGCVSENALLSHDLFEGIHGRAALDTGIALIEDLPPTYLLHANRLHRWQRGDWQLLPWVFSRRLSPINRWKLLDNLRRSLIAPALFLWFLAGWIYLPSHSGGPFQTGTWTVAGLPVLAVPILTGLWTILRRRLGGRSSQHSRFTLKNSFFRWLLALTLLPYDAALALESILTTLVRLAVTRRGLLRWTASGQAARLFGNRTALATWWQMAPSPILALLTALLIQAVHPGSLPWAAPFIVLWFTGPGIAAWISRPSRPRTEQLRRKHRLDLRRLARRTWLFFDQHTGPEDHWLPPDHYQESPLGIVAHRTSPTNIGLYLLSVLGAYDLGYIGVLAMTTRLQAGLDSLERLERYRGHLLNWYDTRSLKPLPPPYVSTVDSGNLAACLIALSEGCRSIPHRPILGRESFEGLLDAIGLLDDGFRDLEGDATVRAAVPTLREGTKAILRSIRAAKDDPTSWFAVLLDLQQTGAGRGSNAPWAELDRLIVSLVESCADRLRPEDLQRIRLYHRQIRQQVDFLLRLIQMFVPWEASFHRPPAAVQPEGGPPRLAEGLNQLRAAFPRQPALADIPAICQSGQEALTRFQEWVQVQDPSLWESLRPWAEDLGRAVENAGMTARAFLISQAQLARRCTDLVNGMDFRFLFDPRRQVFHLGYNAAAGTLDPNYYDLLASEARLASLVAIAKGDIPQSHWLHLARPFTRVDGRQALISWSASMFEYLMPRLLVDSRSGTLLGQTVEAVADRQIAYGLEKGVPWGISESGYYRFDPNQLYQYRAFGVPGLGFKRGLADDLVITPYASLLALPIRPRAVVRNIERLRSLAMIGTYGFYEAIDYTSSRLELGQKAAIVKSYMAHHQGMILLSLVNYLKGDPMVRRFQGEPRIQSIELLLQEQIPRDAPTETPNPETAAGLRPIQTRLAATPWQADPLAPQPRVTHLSNGRYGLLISAGGAGQSSWEGIQLTRWRADSTLEDWGSWLYVEDLANGALWSAALQPSRSTGDDHRVLLGGHIAEFRRRDKLLTQDTVVFIAPDDDIEVRLVTLNNHDSRARKLRLTSYAEVVLAPQSADARHPAFVKLFVEGEPLPEGSGLIFHRRPISAVEKPIYLAHAVVPASRRLTLLTPAAPPAIEIDRRRFLGRGCTARRPRALRPGPPTPPEPSLDPIFSIGQEVSIPPHGNAQVGFVTAAGRSAQDCRALLDRFASLDALRSEMLRTQARVEAEMNELQISNSMMRDLQTLLSALIYPSPALRVDPQRLAANRKGQPGLWPFAISGDHPILVARFGTTEELPLAHDLLKAHEFWRRRGLMIDLVLMDRQEGSYNRELTTQLQRLVANTGNDDWLNRRGGIFVLQAGQCEEADRILLETAARAVLDGSRGALADQLRSAPGLGRRPAHLPRFQPVSMGVEDLEATPPLPRPTGLAFDNGLGGFTPDGREYCIYLEAGQATPAPWINVIANPRFGCITSESGLGTTWAENSAENRLTPWRNDPVSNAPAEAIYLRDEETARVWSPTPLPAPASAPYLIRHGAGYTVFEHRSHGLRQSARVFVPPDSPIKIVELRLQNTWRRPRRITATYYAEWVLGLDREQTQQYLIPEFDAQSQALLVRNPFNGEFADRIAFAAANKPLHGLTADRTEFLGRAGSLQEPAALERIGLAGTVEPGRDPCAALQLHLDLPPGGSETVWFLLGQAESRAAALELVSRFQDPRQVAAAWKANLRRWGDLLGTVQVQTPEPAFDLLLNRWLLYQALSCRLWGRTALYQSGGAYGFRDQLQDVLALLPSQPQLAREHLLRAAGRQFEAGDVLHWWHPPSGRGVRTRFSDDLLWLPYAVSEYMRATGDDTVLDEEVPFLEAPPLEEGQDERYGHFPQTAQSFTLFEHCRRAVQRGTTSGSHGLPLIGGGDWNDGMNRVGRQGRGESVWLAWFLIDVLKRFGDLCQQRGETELASRCRRQAAAFIQAAERNAWDGAWYRRGFYDDGTPLGSAQSEECQIDSIAQSWAVLSGAARPGRAARAMRSVAERLIRRDERLVLLFAPPFDRSARDPGYIQGYLPGIRENGGQYTHAAVWAAWAYAELGQPEEAFEIFRFCNPILRSDEAGKAARYRVEPYAVAADIYSAPPFTGQGGWTWYTGSSGWMYRLGLERLLGVRLRGDCLEIDPRLPGRWPGFSLTWRFGRAVYRIRVENPDRVARGVGEILLDGRSLPGTRIPIDRRRGSHTVQVRMGEPSRSVPTNDDIIGS